MSFPKGPNIFSQTNPRCIPNVQQSVKVERKYMMPSPSYRTYDNNDLLPKLSTS